MPPLSDVGAFDGDTIRALITELDARLDTRCRRPNLHRGRSSNGTRLQPPAHHE